MNTEETPTDFNLLVSTYRGCESGAIQELRSLLRDIGDSEPLIEKTRMSGLIRAKTMLEPVQLVARFRMILKERPWIFRYILRAVPVMKIVRADLEEIRRAAGELEATIGLGETFRITLEKRGSTLGSQEIIESAASTIHRKVDLSNPDRIILVEILGNQAGLSLIYPTDIFSSVKEKRALWQETF